MHSEKKLMNTNRLKDIQYGIKVICLREIQTDITNMAMISLKMPSLYIMLMGI